MSKTTFPIPVDLRAEQTVQRHPMTVAETNQNVGLGVETPVQPKKTESYNDLIDKPSIEGVPLIGDKTFPQLNLAWLTNTELENLLQL